MSHRHERQHDVPPPAGSPGAALGSTAKEPLNAAFHVQLAHSSKWSQPRGTTPTSVVIHCTAATNPASSTAAFFASSAPSGSTQAVADDFEGFTCVPDNAVCAGAPPLNQEGLHIEQPGLETWTRDVWLSHMDQLKRVAYHVAEWCKTYDIPVVLLHTADLVRLGEKAKGITYHQAVSDAFHQSTHQDPGPGFPWDVFMPWVKQYATGTGDDDMSNWVDGWNARRGDTSSKPTIPDGKPQEWQAGWHAQDRIIALEKAPAGPLPTHTHKVQGTAT